MNSPPLTSEKLANMFDHTCLKAFAAEADFIKLCGESTKYGFKMVAINSAVVGLCKRLLQGSKVHVGAAISFPLGQTTIATKLFETADAIKNGVDEIDYVINVGELKNKNTAYIEDEMTQIVQLCKGHQIISKVIFENCYLTKDEIKELCKIALRVKPDFIKTSTGFGTSGATYDDIKLMKDMVGNEVKVKASGGIRDLDTCLKMIEAGAQRIGSSNSVQIIEAYNVRAMG